MGKEDYKNEKKGHGFLCVPKELLFDNRYKQLTIEAILLYAYMLDRLKLSIENGWKDSDGKVFIYFSLESIMDLLKCSKGKAISTLKELDEKHGIGLIEKKRSGYGKCSRIYVKEIFELSVSENEKTREKNEEDLEVTNKKHEKSKNKMSRSSKIEPIEVKKINPNNTNKSNTNKSNTKSNHIFRKDMEEKITIEQQIRTNIDYDSLLLTHREDVEQIDEIAHQGEAFGDEDDMLFVNMQFSDNRYAVLEWGSAFHWPEHYVLIQGTKGAIKIDMCDCGGTLKIDGKDEHFLVHESQEEDDDRTRIYHSTEMDGAIMYGKPGKKPPMWLHSIMKNEMKYLNGILHGKEVDEEFRPLLTGEAARAAIATADACTRSRFEDRKVKLSEIIG